MTYEPNPIPASPEDIPRYVTQEFRKIADSINISENEGVATIPTAVSSTPYTVLITDRVLEVDASAADITVSLLPAAAFTGRTLIIKRVDTSSTYSVTIDGDGAETIDGDTTQVLYPLESFQMYSNGVSWEVV